MTRRGRGRPRHPDILTPAEWRVLEHLHTGATYAEVAVRLGVSPDAVRFHVRNMRAKLNLRDRAELVAWRPPAGERRRPFSTLMPLVGGLLFAARPIAVLAAVAVVTGAIIVAIVLVVSTRAGGEAAPSSVVPAMASLTATPMATPPLHAVVISKGATDSLRLEWAGGAHGATFQYRYAAWNKEKRESDPWTEWTALPAGRFFEVTGLSAETGHFFEVRTVVDGEQDELVLAEGFTQAADGTNMIGPDEIVEGDGTSRWRLHYRSWTMIIPDGMRLRGGRAGVSHGPGPNGIAVVDVVSGSALLLDEHGGEIERHIAEPEPDDVAATEERDVGALFDQIVASVRP